MRDMRARGHGCAGAVALIAALALGGCAHGGPATGAHAAGKGNDAASAPAADSVTIALWRMDETAGTRVADSGPFRLEGVAGLDTRTSFGRYGRARVFTRSIDSFAQVPWNPELEAPDGFTIEAWIWLNSYGTWEDTPIAGRWFGSTGDRSWLFSVVGQSFRPPFAPAVSPGDHSDLVGLASNGLLMFAFLPEDAGSPRPYYSSRPIELQRWTHVAATFDGSVVRLWIDGVLDAQYASVGHLRASQAPLQIGNAIDPRFLSSFGGDLRADPARLSNPFYAFDGMIDELRLSSAARTDFGSARGR
jgi:hypothetical protein